MGSSLEEQVDCFWEREEIASSGGIGDRDRAATPNLAGKDFSHTIARGEHVAKAENSSAGSEDNQLGNALGCAHDGCRLNSLVRREKNEAGTNRSGGAGEDFCGEDVVGDGGERVLFHERNVLEGGGMEDEARGVDGEDVFKQRGIAGTAEEVRNGWGLRDFGGEGEEIAFGSFQQNEVCIQGGKPPGESDANGASSAGDEDGLTGQDGKLFWWWRGQRSTGEEGLPVDVLEGRNHFSSINCHCMERALAGGSLELVLVELAALPQTKSQS